MLSEHKARFMDRVWAEVDKHDQFAKLSDAERFSMASTVAIKQAKQSETVQDARQHMYTGLSLVVDACKATKIVVCSRGCSAFSGLNA